MSQTPGEGFPADRGGPPGQRHCDYCGARLDPTVYFCRGCGKPYQAVERVLPHVPPPRLSDGELVRRKTPQVFNLCWTFTAAVLIVGFLSYVFFRDRPDLAFLYSSAAIFCLSFVYAVLFFGDLWRQFRRPGFDRWEAWAALAALPLLFLLNYAYHSFLVHYAGAEMVSWEELRAAGVDQASLVFSVAVLPAVAEEVAFRGLLQEWLELAIKPQRALLLASAFFMFLHFSILSAPYLFLVGLVLGWVKQRTGSLYPSILIHFLHNLAALAFPF
jgi:membrane protease YdiL (CAAX protease family)